MSSLEIKGIYFLMPGRWWPYGLNIKQKLWWRFVPGSYISVKWPSGEIRVRQEEWHTWDYVRSADPNDHYRPWLEEHVGQQGRDWDWGIADRDATENRLIIKIRQRHAKYATLAAIKWS